MSTEQDNVDAAKNPVGDKAEETKIDPKEYAEMKAENERLKSFHDKVTKEKQEAVNKAKAEADKAAREKAEAEGNYKELLALKEKELVDLQSKYDNEINSYKQAEVTNKINSAANALANQLTKHAAKAADLTEKLAKRIKLTDNGIVVTDDKGAITSDKLDSLLEFARKNYDYLCDGLQSTGTAGLQSVKSTGKSTNEDDMLSPIERLNRARGIE